MIEAGMQNAAAHSPHLRMAALVMLCIGLSITGCGSDADLVDTAGTNAPAGPESIRLIDAPAELTGTGLGLGVAPILESAAIGNGRLFVTSFDSTNAAFLASYVVDVRAGNFERVDDLSTDGSILMPRFASHAETVVASGTICPGGSVESTDNGPACLSGEPAIGLWRLDQHDGSWVEVVRIERTEIDADLDERIISTRLVGTAQGRAVLQISPVNPDVLSALVHVNVRTGDWTQQHLPIGSSAECVSESGSVALAAGEHRDMEDPETPEPPVHRLAVIREGSGAEDVMQLPEQWVLACGPADIDIITETEWIEVRFDGTVTSTTLLPASMLPDNRRYTDHVIGSGTPSTGLLREFERIEDHHLSVGILATHGAKPITHELPFNEAVIVVVDTATLLPDGSIAALVTRIPGLGDEPPPEADLLIAS